MGSLMLRHTADGVMQQFRQTGISPKPLELLVKNLGGFPGSRRVPKDENFAASQKWRKS
jgi:hypothetical protein